MDVRKIIQITSHDGFLHALCDDGSIWSMVNMAWYPVTLGTIYGEILTFIPNDKMCRMRDE